MDCLFCVRFIRNFALRNSQFREMVTKEQVESFLEELHTKMKIFGILFRDDREKNRNTLQELEIVPSYRKVVVENLHVEDYVQGPVVDELNRLGEMWVFGKDVKGREIYIKVMISGTTSQTICISFHFAEHPLAYPFKEK